MNDIAEHERRFHDHGERVDEPYPEQSEQPLRTGVAKIISNDGGGTYTITEQVWTGYAWANGTAPGHYVNVSARDYNSSTAGCVDDIVFFWEQYDEDGTIELIVKVSENTDEKVASASGETADYLENVATSDDTWIALTTVGSTVSWTHIGPHTSAHSGGCQGCGDCAVSYVDIDSKGHVRVVGFQSGCNFGPCA